MSTLVSDSLGIPCSELRPEPEQEKARAHGRPWDEPGGVGVERELERESVQDRNRSWRYPRSDCVDMDELAQSRNHQILP